MSQELLDDIKKEIEVNSILLFIKGSKEMPMCGFSARTIEVFKELGKPFKTIDILPDPELAAERCKRRDAFRLARR